MNQCHTFEALQNLYSVQRAERLAYIDFRLQYMGIINRADLKELFGIAEAAASKELTEYKNLRPSNVEYDRALRANSILRGSFTPLIQMEAETALGMLANGFNKNKLFNEPLIAYQRIGVLSRKLKPEIVSKITRAIHQKTGVLCSYLSASSNNHGSRMLFPTALFFDGKSWMFRAFDRKEDPDEGKFKCFNFSRVTQVDELPKEAAKIGETLEKDRDWQVTIPIHLTLHSSLDNEQREIVRQDFGMDADENELVTFERAALAWFLLKQWGVDTSSGVSKPDEKLFYKFNLKNIDTLKHIDSVKSIFKN